MPARISLPRTTLFDNLRIAAERYPDKPALVCGERVVRWKELQSAAEHIAGWLQAHAGVAHGDSVLLYAQNSLEFIIAYHAILRAEAIVVPVNPMFLMEELSHLADDSGAAVLIGASPLLPQIAPLLGGSLRHALLFAVDDATSAERGFPVVSAR